MAPATSMVTGSMTCYWARLSACVSSTGPAPRSRWPAEGIMQQRRYWTWLVLLAGACGLDTRAPGVATSSTPESETADDTSPRNTEPPSAPAESERAGPVRGGEAPENADQDPAQAGITGETAALGGCDACVVAGGQCEGT